MPSVSHLGHRRRFARVILASLAMTSLWVGTSVPAQDSGTEAPQKVFKMTAENWKWSPDTLRVAVGTRVLLKIRSYDSTHRFDLKAYGLKVVLVQDRVTDVEFVADKVGKFKWKCGRPCGNGCPKMRGTLTVYEPTEGDAGGG